MNITQIEIDKIVKIALKSTSNANDHSIEHKEIEGSSLDSIYRYHIYTEFLKVSGEEDDDNNDGELFSQMYKEINKSLSTVENIEFEIDSAEKGYWVIDISQSKTQQDTKDIEEDIAEEFITIKSKQDLLKTLESVIGHFEKWKFFKSWKCPTDKKKQIALIRMNSFKKKFTWEDKKYEVEFRVVITDRDTQEPKLMVFKTTLIDNVKLNITALQQLWDEVVSEKTTINKRSFNKIYNVITDKLEIALDEYKKGDFLKPEVLRFDSKVGAIIANDTDEESIITIKIDYWNLFKDTDINNLDDKFIRNIAEKLLDNLSFKK